MIDSYTLIILKLDIFLCIAKTLTNKIIWNIILNMKQLHNAQDAIEQAILEGEYEPIESAIKCEKPQSFEHCFCDPLFWQALGKAREWDKADLLDSGDIECHYITLPEFYAHQWLQIRLHKNDTNNLFDGNEQKFWESL